MSAPWPYQPPQNVAPPPPYAGWWWRVLASLTDWSLAFLFLAVPAIPLAAVGYLTLEEDTVDTLIDIVSIPWTIAFLLLYYPLTMRREGIHNGQTWGKQVCRIRVVKTDGWPVDASTAIMREVVIKYLLFSIVAACALFIPTILDYLWPLWDERNEALHDKMAHTWVVRADVLPPGVWVPPVPPAAGGPVEWGP